MLLIWGWSAAGLALVAAGARPASADDTSVVIATTSIWSDIVDRVDCGDHFAVETLIPAGGDAHAFEPSMRDRATLGEAALVVANGGGLEELLDDTLAAVADDGTPVLTVFDHVGDGDDPHLWFDPALVAEAAPEIGEALIAAGADEPTTEQCVAEVIAEIEALDAELREILSVVPAGRRLLVTNHDALGRFADRYDFEILGSVLPGSSTLAEASPAELEQLSSEIESAGVPAIFAEALDSVDEATTLADRLGVDVVMLYTDALGEQGSGAETYAGLMRFDATAIADALGEPP
jgi:zinc/manganese transport system substrate-binding protein